MDLLFTLGILAQVGACPKEMENTQRKIVDVLLLGHHLRRSASLFTPSWRPNPSQVRVHLGVQEQCVVKRTPRLHMALVFNVPYMDGKIIS